MGRLNFVEKANIVHINKYDYSEVNYINNRTKVVIICPKHGNFSQSPSNHLAGKGCKICYLENKSFSKEIFIERANKIHNFKYEYLFFDNFDVKNKIGIICPIHGLFHQTPDAHIYSMSGCFECGKISRGKLTVNSNEYFIQQSNIIHNNKYDYSKSIYLKNRESVIIICPTHGEFKQMAMAHLAGKGCKKCANSISHKETKWLDDLGIPIQNRNLSIKICNTYIKPDGFDPITNTIYEYYGDYWHGNPKVYDENHINLHNKKLFKDLYNKTIERENMIRVAGFKLVSVWQYDLEHHIK